MPVIKIWGIPLDETEDRLKEITLHVIFSVVSVSELKLKKDDVTILFPKDMMADGLGEEIIVEITGLFSRQERTNEVRQMLARFVGQCLKSFYTEAKVECFVYLFEENQGFWTS